MDGGTTERLYGVWGSSGSDVFAVGEAGTILHYDGATWIPMSSGTTDSLFGVWGSSGSDVFAVGYPGTILHYDAADWHEMSRGNTNDLYDVWGSGGSEVFAVGSYGTILHYSGQPQYVDQPVVPESSTLLLLGLGGAVLVAYIGVQRWIRRGAGMG
jgi:hypothetical protein